MYIEKYYQEMKSVLEKIEQTQTETIKKCAKVIADSLVNGGAWHIQDSGHMLMHELITRSGGLAAIKPIQLNISIKDEVREREGDKDAGFSVYKIPEFASLVVQSSKLRKGDVLVIGSTSGYSVFPVELALLAKKMGVITIAMTTKSYSETLKSQHPSGLRLFEACDYYFDNCSNEGDAIVKLEEVDKNIAPASGIGAAYIMWALQVGVAEELIKMGKNPSIYKSIHAKDGPEVFKKANEQYAKEGY